MNNKHYFEDEYEATETEFNSVALTLALFIMTVATGISGVLLLFWAIANVT